MRLTEVFERTGARKAFVAYITAGDGGLEATGRYVSALGRAGVDIVELGVPHSDPVADGPTNIAAAARALSRGTTLAGILDLVRQLRAAGEQVPVVLFTYYNPVLRLGLDEFARRAKASGVDGALIVDLPPEEADEYRVAMAAHGLGSVFLASPTTPADRLASISAASSGFVYYVSRCGVTGVQQALSETLSQEVAEVRRRVNHPVCVGFGISTPEQVRAVGEVADGVVVGSAFVKCLEEAQDPETGERRLFDLATRLIGGLAC